MQRPTGVSIISALSFFFAICLAIGGVLLYTKSPLLAPYLANIPAGSRLAESIGTVGAVACFCFAALYAIVGYGLWALKNWGRILAIVLMVLGVIFGLIGVVGSMHMATSMIVGQIIRLLISVWILWYLFQPNVKKAFGQAA